MDPIGGGTMSGVRGLPAALALAAVLAACGGDGTTPRAGGTSPDATPPLTAGVNDQGTQDITAGGKLTLELGDRYFKPTYLKAKPGQSINVELENEGMLAHNFSIQAMGIDETVQAGAKKELTFTLPSSGDVAFFCKFHADDGMRGTFFFGATPGATGETPGGRGY
jgi:plastocyanin